MWATGNDKAIGRRGVLHEEREISRRLAILLVSFARPQHNKANEHLAKGVIRARGPRARGAATAQGPGRWMVRLASGRTRPAWI